MAVPIDTFSNRLKTALALRNMKPIDIANKIGIHRGIMSKYLNNKYKPKHDRIYQLAEALNVNVVWLMGYDVPIEEKVTDLSLDETVDLLLYTLEDADTPKDMKREMLRKILIDNEINMRINDER